MERNWRRPRRRASGEYEFQRAFKACLPCARRKVKCMPADDGNACLRCCKKRIDCIFSTKKPWSRGHNGKQLAISCQDTGPHPRDSPVTTRVDHESAEPSRAEASRPALQIQQEWPGTVVDESIHQLASHQQNESINASFRGVHGDITGEDGLPTSILRNVVSNSNDAMNLLFGAAPQGEPNNTPSTHPASKNGSTDYIPTSFADPNTRDQPDSTNVDVLRVWNACRFVKMGWLTAHEAITLVDLFFANISPLSPILTDFFGSRANQFWLVTQEPMLCCTILMISSRCHDIPVVGGRSRSFFIHHRLWQHCQHLLLRVMLGQEKLSKAKTRNIGTIEALILMSEWYPQALQFPPENDGWDADLIMSLPDVRDPPSLAETPVSARWRDDVVEPTKRFERMSWMTLSAALALAHELGVFSSSARFQKQDDLVERNAEAYLENLEVRRRRLPWLLFVLVNVLSSRIGCTSPMQSSVDIFSLRTRWPLEPLVDEKWLSYMNSWVQLTELCTSIMDNLFPFMNVHLPVGATDAFTAELEQRQILLSNWKRRNLDPQGPGILHDILFIEYNDLRVLTNSIGMQRIVHKVLLQNHTQDEPTIGHSFITRARQLNMTGREYGFIEEVIDGCCQVLEKVASLSTSGSLYYLPMRVLFRTINSSIFLTKALALGVRSGKLQGALQILDQTVVALQGNCLDDFYLQSRYAALLQDLISRLRQSLLSSYSASAVSYNGTDPEPVSNANFTSSPTLDTYAAQAETANLRVDDLSHVNLDSWLSLPFDPSMAPFGPCEGNFGLGLDGADLDLSFIWQLPP